MSTLTQDIRFGLRSLLRQPGFSAVAVLTLALGIGGTTAVFSLVNAVLLRQLPYSDPERMVMVWETNHPRDRERNVVSSANFLAWRDAAESFESLAALRVQPVQLTGVDEPEEVIEATTSTGYFRILDGRPMLGRTFQPEEDVEGRHRVVVLSHSFWNRRFGANPDVLGQILELGGNPHTILGVMPPDFRSVSPAYPIGGGDVELWVPIAFGPEARNRSGRYLSVLGRLSPGVDLDEAQAEMDTIASRLEQEHPERNEGWGVNVVPLLEQTVGEARPTMWILFGAVGTILLIACVNVAGLLLARAIQRKKEVAIRTSLGAGRGRIIRQLLTESVILAGAGGVVGLVVAFLGTEVLIQGLPDSISIPRRDEIQINGTVLAFAGAISLLSGLVFGLVPAWESTKTHLMETIKGAAFPTGSRLQGLRLKSTLVIGQIALALVLLIGSGLLIRSFALLTRVDPGVNVEQVLTARILLPSTRYPEKHQKVAFFDELFSRLETLPGIRSAGGTFFLPLSGLRSATSFWREDQPEPSPGEKPVADIRVVSSSYFQTLHVPLVKGRLFGNQDRAETTNAFIINEAMVRAFYSDEDPLGKRLVYNWGEPLGGEIVGVVGDVRHAALDGQPRPAIYRPYAQKDLGLMHLVVRAEGEPKDLSRALAGELRAIDPDQPLAAVRTLEAVLSSSVASPRLNMTLLGAFAVVALLLASLGIYGVISYTVSQRAHEMGIRRALGAQTGDLLRLVANQGFRLTVLGIILGLAMALAATRALSSLIFGVTTTDSITFLVAPLVLCGVSLLACFPPARRATKVDPVVALRCE